MLYADYGFYQAGSADCEGLTCNCASAVAIWYVVLDRISCAASYGRHTMRIVVQLY